MAKAKSKLKKVMMQNMVNKTFIMTLQPIGKDKFIVHSIVPARESKETNPEAGHMKFFVICHKLCIYTSIGADNIHHASNKATKLFGPNWSQITQDAGIGKGYQFFGVTHFNDLLKTLSI
jgi:hypothetical protein